MKDKIRELFATNQIGLYPIRNPNGADEYCCPGCGASTRIMGHAHGTEHIADVTHRSDCELYELYQSTLEPNNEE